MFQDLNEKLGKKSLAKEELQKIFGELVSNLETYIGFDILYKKFIVDLSDDEFQNDVFSLGGKREIFSHDSVIKITFSSEMKEFFPFIFLREAFYLFLPEKLLSQEEVGIIILKIVENELSFLNNKKWKNTTENMMVNTEYIQNQFDSLEKFIELNRDSKTRMISFIIRSLRNNFNVIDEYESIFERIHKDFVLLYSNVEYPDYVVDTLYCLCKIFFKVKSYRTLLDYKNHFVDFQEKGEITTDLSIRKFTEGIEWIDNNTGLAPSYSLDWRGFDAMVLDTFFKFNPMVPPHLIRTLMEEMPFFDVIKSTQDQFSNYVHGFFVIPSKYQSDIRLFLQRLEGQGLIDYKSAGVYFIQYNNVNLNYFKSFYLPRTIIDPERSEYRKDYEIRLKLTQRKEIEERSMDLLDLFLLSRIQMFSYSGLPFERRSRNTRKLKRDLKNHVIAKLKDLKFLESLFNRLNEEQSLRQVLGGYVQYAESNGLITTFQRVNSLLKIIPHLSNIIEMLEQKRSLRPQKSFKWFGESINSWTNPPIISHYIAKHGITDNLIKNNLYKDKEVQDWLYKNYIPIRLRSKSEADRLENQLNDVQDFFRVMLELKLYDINAIRMIVGDENIRQKIIWQKREIFREIKNDKRIKDLSGTLLEDIIDDFSNRERPLIHPTLINTLTTLHIGKLFLFAKIEYTPKNWEKAKKLISYFIRVIMLNAEDVFTRKKYIKLEIYSVNITNEEKYILMCALYNIFGEDIIFVKRFFFDGTIPVYKFRDFYDFKRKEFFYQKDVIKEFFTYSHNLLKEYTRDQPTKQYRRIYFAKNLGFEDLINSVRYRISKEKLLFTAEDTYNLMKFRNNLVENLLLGNEDFASFKNEGFYSLIDHIKFMPNFAKFGFSNYFLYFIPYNLEDIDMKLLLLNSIKGVETPAFIDIVNLFLVSYVFPYNEFNFPYFNWLHKTKNAFKEFIIFKATKFHTSIQFDRNIESSGWDINITKFKNYCNRIIFNSSEMRRNSNLRSFDVSLKSEKQYGLNTSEYNALKDLYLFEDIDLKSHLGLTKRQNTIDKITLLLKKHLIFPYLEYKNLSLIDEIVIILPEVDPQSVPTLIQIFSYFNFVQIYEGNVHYYIQGGVQEEQKSGLIVKIFLPETDTSDIQLQFRHVFQYYDIKYYIFLHDLITNQELLRHIFGKKFDSMNFSPLNLKWNDKDQKWMNHRPLGENFEKFYPDLDFNKEEI